MAAQKPGLDPNAAVRIGGRRSGGASSGSTPAATSTPQPEQPPAAVAAPVGILAALGATAEQPVQPGERIIDILVDQIAPHPANLRPIGDVAELGESIAEAELHQPLIVVEREAFLANNPDHSLDEHLRYVLIDGHQRHAGATAAKVATLPAVVRNRLAGDEDTVVTMLITGLMRIGLTPMQEARGFGRLRDKGWSERRISEKTRLSPGQVHKRLSLLRLPDKVAAVLEAGELPVSSALQLLKLPDDEIAAAWAQAKREDWRGVEGVVTSRLAINAAQAAAQTLRAQLTNARVRVVEDLDRYGVEHWHHRLPNQNYYVPGVEYAGRGVAGNPATGERVPPTVAAYVSTNGNRVHLEWYSDQDQHAPTVEDDDEAPAPTGPTDADGAAGSAVVTGGAGASAGSTRPAGGAGETADAAADRELEQERDRQLQERQRQLHERQLRAEAARVAADARAAACKRLATGRLDPELAVEILADVMLDDGAIEPYNVAATAAEFCGIPIVEEDPLVADDVDDDDDAVSVWLAVQAQAGPLPARRAAVAVALAQVEDTLAAADRRADRWTALQVRHVRRLAAHAGYELTPEDDQRIAEVLGTAGPAAADVPLDPDPGASAGSTPAATPHADGATS